MNWRIEFADASQNVALFVSQYPHCLADLLHRHQASEFRCNLAMIASNHEAAELRTLVQHEMEYVAEFSVPIVAEVGLGPNWRDIK
jgi:formyltetrahydrofolate hydrolase